LDTPDGWSQYIAALATGGNASPLWTALVCPRGNRRCSCRSSYSRPVPQTLVRSCVRPKERLTVDLGQGNLAPLKVKFDRSGVARIRSCRQPQLPIRWWFAPSAWLIVILGTFSLNRIYYHHCHGKIMPCSRSVSIRRGWSGVAMSTTAEGKAD
jgi:hypothetical protein